jgi:hypothetical protein
MPFAAILALAVVLVVLSAGLGMVLLARFLTSEADEDQALRFDPFARPRRPPSLRLLDFILFLRNRPKQIGYRRDARGRFRKL